MSDTEDKRISDLYGRLERQQPSEMMDARIRRMAREHLDQQQPDKALPARSYRWQWLSVAAVMVLSVGVVLRVFEQQPDMTVLEEAADAEMAPELKSIIKPAVKATANQAIMDRAAEPVFSVEAEKSKRALPAAALAPASEAVLGGQAAMPRQKAAAFESGMPAPETALSADSAVTEDMQNAVSLPEKKEQASPAASKCADEVLLASRDQKLWLERIDLLRAEDKQAQARCLELLMQEVFAE